MPLLYGERKTTSRGLPASLVSPTRALLASPSARTLSLMEQNLAKTMEILDFAMVVTAAKYLHEATGSSNIESYTTVQVLQQKGYTIR